MSELADTPKPSYWAVIFASVRTDVDAEHYSQTADEMMALAAEQPGYLGVESVHDAATGAGITVSYWADEEAIAGWQAQADHLIAQRLGRERWYRAYRLRVARVERAATFERQD